MATATRSGKVMSTDDEAQIEEELAPTFAPKASEPEEADTLFDGGPTMVEVEQWKQETGCDIYVTSVTPERHIVWRTLTRFEYRRLVKNLEQTVSSGTLSQAEANLNNEEAIVDICVLFPKLSRTEYAGAMAGIPSLIAQQVMEASGFSSVDVRSL